MKSITDMAIRNAKAKDKPYRITIGSNIYCEVLTTGRKVWRMRFFREPGTNKPAIFTIGRYLDDKENPLHVSLKQAQLSADDAKCLIAQASVYNVLRDK